MRMRIGLSPRGIEMPESKELKIKDLRPKMKNVTVEGRLMKVSGAQRTKKGLQYFGFLKQGNHRARIRLESDMIGTVERGQFLRLLSFNTLEGRLTLVPTEKSIIVANGKRVWVSRELREMEARRKRELTTSE
jgi:hypothetical protein